MQFRPCIDIHNGKVKQIVGSSLSDTKNRPDENFVSDLTAADYAKLYREHRLYGGHVILLNKEGTPEYEQTKAEAFRALGEFPGGLQVGGGINAENASQFLEAGAGHVIVTSYVFTGGRINYDNLRKLYRKVGRERLVLDLSCRYAEEQNGRPAGYYIVTDRWQNMTGERIDNSLLENLSACCSEFLIHAVDVEGKNSGIEKPLVALLAAWNQIPVTYAGGIHSMEDIEVIRELGRGRMNFTVGSSLDLFGGPLSFEEICRSAEQLF